MSVTHASSRRLLIPRFGTILALSLGPAVAVSFARFAYALLVPSMRADLDLTYAEAGLVNTANALGYLAGALFVARYESRVGNRSMFSTAVALTALSLLVAGTTNLYMAHVALRALSGFAGAAVFICGAVLASNTFAGDPKRASVGMAVYFSGAGIGIVLSALLVPTLLAALGNEAWQTAWLVIGGIASVFAVVAIHAARHMDEPAGSAEPSTWSLRTFRPVAGSYFLFGAGYIGYMTFVVAWLVGHGARPTEVSLFWGVLGIATIVAPVVWRTPRARLGPETLLVMAGLVIGTGAAIPLIATAPAAMMFSAVLFGLAMFTVPAAVTDMVRTALPRTSWAPAVAAITVVFAAGQAIGPVLTGWLSDSMQSLYGGLAGSVAMLLGASAVAALQKPVPTVRPGPAILYPARITSRAHPVR